MPVQWRYHQKDKYRKNKVSVGKKGLNIKKLPAFSLSELIEITQHDENIKEKQTMKRIQSEYKLHFASI